MSSKNLHMILLAGFAAIFVLAVFGIFDPAKPGRAGVKKGAKSQQACVQEIKRKFKKSGVALDMEKASAAYADCFSK